MAQRDRVGEEPGETVASEGKASVSNKQDEQVEEELTVLPRCSGKGVVGTVMYGQPSLLLLLLSAPETASMTTKPFLSVSVTTKHKSHASCSSCSGINCGYTSVVCHQQHL